jgi:drug/metabolite transporter, DME family
LVLRPRVIHLHDIDSRCVLRFTERFLVRAPQYVHQKGAALLEPGHRRNQRSLDQYYFSLGPLHLVCAVVFFDQRFDCDLCCGWPVSAGLTRLLSYKGIDALGVAITDPIRATTPLFSAMMAIIFLGEKLTSPIVVATVMIIAGIILLSSRNGSMKLTSSAGFLWYPIAASALAGATQVVRKVGLAAVPHPLVAAAVTATSSFVVSILTLWYVERSQETWKMNRQCFWWFLAAGITISFGMVCIHYALDLGKVSVVIPIASTGPFFSLILAATFLRDVERVTSRIIFSATMIVGGVVLLTLWK